MTEANSKNRLDSLALEDLSDVVDRLGADLRISRSVAEEEAVIFVLIQWVIPRDDLDSGSSLHQAPNLIVFQSAVDGQNSGRSFGIDDLGLLRATK